MLWHIMHIPIATGIQNERVSLKKKQFYFAKKMFFFRLYFREEGHLYSKCLFDILTIYHKFYILHFFSRGIRIQISTLTKLQNGCISLRKRVFFC